ncbi:hypothetical protein [Streptomyces sp. H39-C1]|uniref:hypothetical protein n=1 Tax=Streptomyces sp. H39-C1 TaxID=3004355 RepID=UPI0022AEAC1A|nr:hypothetical protein [Streptomyces sp. H39-C1]MCZ4099839.1 hypothetical protein [Streptomyces sp. H39-C1]
MAFPQTPNDVRTEFQLGGVWTDISADVYLRNPIAITRGRADEGTRADPAKCPLTINNRSGKYSPRNPTGAYFGMIGRNTPLRISVPADATHLRAVGTGASEMTTPDSALLSIVGDLDVRIEVALDSWQSEQSLCGKYRTASNDLSWAFRLTAGGLLELRTTMDGFALFPGFIDAISTVAVSAPTSGRLALRATIDVNNGAGGCTVVFYTAPAIGGTWTQLGAPVVTAEVVTIFDSTAPLEVGDVTDLSSPMSGKVYAFQLYDGIAGTIRANPNLTIQAVGATSFADTAGTPNTWTVAATSGISDRDYRAHVEVSAWPQRWDVSGKDVYVPIETAGTLRRLGQGQAPLQSTLRRGLVTLAATPPVAYWPCEDDAGSTVLASGLTGGTPMSISGASDLAADESFAASKPLPLINGATWTGAVAPYTNTGTHQTRFCLRIPAAGATNGAVIMRVLTSGTVARFDLVYATALGGSVGINAYGADGTLLVASIVSAAGDGYNGDLSRFGMAIKQVGADVQFGMESTSVGSGSGGGSIDTVVGRTCGLVQRVIVDPNGNMGASVYGHISVQTDGGAIADLAGQLSAYIGETAGRRIQRLCREEAIPFRPVGGLDDSAALGAQSVATLLTLLDEAAAADLGILYEPREVLGLAYRTRASLYNQSPTLALDYVVRGEVTPPLEPTDDDQNPRNDVTASRKGGSSARASLNTGPMSVLAPPAGIGLYDTSESYNVAGDDQLLDIASWRVHEGTWDEARYPQVNVDLAAGPHLIATGAKSLDCGDRLTISHPPAGQPPDTIDQFVVGYTETLGVYDWDMQLNCIPAGPWTVGILDDPVLGRVDTDGSVLAAATTDTATTWYVATTSYPLWTTDGAEAPLDIRAGGETVTATAIANAAGDAFGRTASSGWGTADSGQAWANTGGAAGDYSVSGGLGRHSLTSVNVSRYTTMPGQGSDFDLTISMGTSVLATGASHFEHVVARFNGTTDMLLARLEFTTAAGVILGIRKRVAGVETQLATITTSLTHVAGSLYGVHFQGLGSRLRANAWLASGAEPTQWLLDITDSSVMAAGDWGVRSILGPGNTNTLPVTATIDNLAVVNPQKFTVARSVNGVAKPQLAGADVRLAHPMIISL